MDRKGIGDRRLWSFLGRFADLSTAAQVVFALAVLAFYSLGSGLGALLGSPLLALSVALISFPAGAAVGALVVHPMGSAWLMRRQCAYETLDVEICARFDGSTLRPADWTQKRVLRALVDGVREIPVIYRYGSDTDRVRVEVVNGGTLQHVRPRPGGPHVALVRFPHDLKAGEVHALEFRQMVPANASDSLPFLTVSPTHPTRRARLRVTFGTVRPSGVYACYWLSSDSDDECHVKLHHPDTSGVVEHVFRRLKPGHKYGLIWEWPDNHLNPPSS